MKATKRSIPRKKNDTRASEFKTFTWIVLLSLCLTAAPIILTSIIAGKEGLLFSYREHAPIWDGGWYLNIFKNGYSGGFPFTKMATIGFFPGYPLLAKAVAFVFHLPAEIAVLATAQACCAGFWIYFFLLLKRWKVPLLWQGMGTALFLSHPSAFYLVMAYSESPFLCALLGYVYWTGSTHRFHWVFAALHGIALTAIRVLGLPLVVFPLLQTAFGSREKLHRKPARYLMPLIVAGISTLGALAFYVYCAVRFGYWDAYFRTQATAWGMPHQLWNFLNPRSYALRFEHLGQRIYWANNPFNDATIPLTALMFVSCLFMEKIHSFTQKFGERLPLYLCAGALFFAMIMQGRADGSGTMHFATSLRYGLVPHLLLILAVLHFVGQKRGISSLVTGTTIVLGGTIAAGLFVLQWTLYLYFVHRTGIV